MLFPNYGNGIMNDTLQQGSQVQVVEDKTTPAEDRYLRLLATRNHRHTARESQEDFQNATGKRMSDQTIRNRLH
ncbi:hypothetical protein ANN_06864 [Periplaneta americana]|uniref:Uncharacterized protein n=1 Tax=Periplaneta americana TaxID=6978 RepID=A0ABQ8TH96_PERAM|nr:hypothetical protein ANN_06864 [Periplaneta americana]